MTRSRRDSERLAIKLASSGYVTSARAMIARCMPGVVVIEVNATKAVH
jgi:hypothetical protein